MMKDIRIEELVAYNLWANRRLITWLKGNNPELMTKKCASSFPSILETINHILDGQLFYYAALKEQAFEKLRGTTIQDTFNGLLEQSEAFVEYVQLQENFNDPRIVKIKIFNGAFPQFELIQHCMNHSTFHRGQIITIGHQLDLTTPPSTDMLYYFIERDKLLATKP